MNHRARNLLLFLTLQIIPAVVGAQDLGEAAGYLSGSIRSDTVSPPGKEWFANPGGGPAGGNCITSTYLWAAGDMSLAQMDLTGPGLLTFQWKVSSLADDGWLICQVSNAGSPVEAGRISGTEDDWRSVRVLIPQGPRTVSWIYRKTTYLAEGEDSGRIAGVTYAAWPAARQTFEQYKAAHGVTGTGSTLMAGRRLDTSWLMGLAPGQATPAGIGQVLPGPGGTARFRTRISLTADGVLDNEFSTDLRSWTMQGRQFEIVPGSLTAGTLDIDYIVPAGPAVFFRQRHAPTQTPPSPGMAYIPPGQFFAGSPTGEVGRVWSGYVSGNHGGEEDHQRQVTLTRGFFLNKYETTWAEWQDVRTWALAHGYAIGTGYEARGGRFLLEEEGGNILDAAPAEDTSELHPATNISIYEAMKWLNAKSERDGLTPCYRVRLRDADENDDQETIVIWRTESLNTEVGRHTEDLMCDWTASGYRLPTDAEWEYACRAGTLTALNNGLNLTHGRHYPSWPVLPAVANVEDPSLDSVASYFGNGGRTRPVGSFQPNAFGLYDMHGNVHEWCWDLYDTLVPQQFSGEPLVDPRGATRGIYRVIRGGSWRMPGHMHRSALRYPSPGGGGNSHEAGFRYARNAPE